MTQEYVTYYSVKYPEYSATITTVQQPKSFYRPFLPNQILTPDWKEAHGFLKWKAEKRVKKAQEELDAALKHQNAVNALQEPNT